MTTTTPAQKTTGTLNVTKAPRGPFKAADLEIYEDRGTLNLNGRLRIASGESVTVSLTVNLVTGPSKGTFANNDKVPFANIGYHKDDGGIYYDAESGDYELTYNKATQNVSGKAHFQSTIAGKKVESAFDFNITGLSG